MAIDPNEITPVTISNLIQTQFPAFYRESGPMFIAFVRAYYEWLESPNNPLYYARRYYAIKDIDTTLEQFVVFFKEKYLKNIQLDTKTDTRLLIKHALDIYRSKGTERCVELLFQLVFNEKVRFYYPSQDLFKLSDGHWFIPRYLELTISENNVLLKNKEIVGITSGARAFVEEVLRRRTNGRIQDIAYISAIFGDFQVNEKIKTIDDSISIDLCPFIVGSLTEVIIDTLGSGNSYNVGDLVSIESDSGFGAEGRVLATTQQFGLVSYTLQDGGYGFVANANVYISNVSMTLANVTSTYVNATSYTYWQDKFTQNVAFINYRSATGILQETNGITTYFGNGSVMGTGSILHLDSQNTSFGTALVQILTGNLQNTFYTSGNAVQANLQASNGYFDVTATGTFIANARNATITLANTSGFIVGEFVRQAGTQGIITAIQGANLEIDDIAGMFRNGLPLSGQDSGISAVQQNIAFDIGLVSVSNSFFSFPGNKIQSNTMTASIELLDDAGSGLAVTVANSFSLQETVSVSNDLIAPYLSVALNAVSYGFPANASANLTNTHIANCFQYSNLTIGKVNTLIQSGAGTNYTHTPFIVLHQPQIWGYSLHDVILDITFPDSDSHFIDGEIVTQAATSARGLVQEFSNSTVVYLQKDRFFENNQFIVTSNSTTTITGNTSGVSANVRIVSANNEAELMGHNIAVKTQFFVGNGAITVIDVFDSGFGYVEGETVNLISDGANGAVGVAHLVTAGKGHGYYRTKGGFLSDSKKLFDGDFYQNYSYQIISRLVLTKYQELIKNISHPAGTKMFGRFVHFSTTNTDVSVSKAKITTTIT